MTFSLILKNNKTMLRPRHSASFKKDYKKLSKSKDIAKLDEIIKKLCNEIPLEQKNKDHELHHNWVGHRECHVGPDWLLIYKRESDSIVFVRTGSHSELF